MMTVQQKRFRQHGRTGASMPVAKNDHAPALRPTWDQPA
jgi:hypothetical protein